MVGESSRDERLRPCPFCGGDATMRSYFYQGMGLTLFWVRHVCDSGRTEIQTSGHASRAEAEREWNRRFEEE